MIFALDSHFYFWCLASHEGKTHKWTSLLLNWDMLSGVLLMILLWFSVASSLWLSMEYYGNLQEKHLLKKFSYVQLCSLHSCQYSFSFLERAPHFYSNPKKKWFHALLLSLHQQITFCLIMKERLTNSFAISNEALTMGDKNNCCIFLMRLKKFYLHL